MILSIEQLLSLMLGVISYKVQENDYLSVYSFSEEQIKYFEFSEFFLDRCKFQSSITIEFKTGASKISFDYNIVKIGSKDSIDIYVNGKEYKSIKINEIDNKGNIEVLLPNKEKEVCIYYPIDLELAIRNFNIDGDYEVIPPRKEKVLWLGDSITQGYGSDLTSYSYVNVANRILKYEVINQGIGGYYYDYKSLLPLNNFYPDKIIISLGTNQIYSLDIKETIDMFYNRLSELYPNVETIVITPIYRSDVDNALDLVINIRNLIVNKCKNYKNIKIINGLELIPHQEYLFKDKLHPNELGMKIYGENLSKIILENKK